MKNLSLTQTQKTVLFFTVVAIVIVLIRVATPLIHK